MTSIHDVPEVWVLGVAVNKVRRDPRSCNDTVVGSLFLFTTDIPNVTRSLTQRLNVESLKSFQDRVMLVATWAATSASVLMLVSKKISASSSVSGISLGPRTC